MAVGLAGANGALGSPKLRAALTDVFAGAVGSVLSIAYSLSYAALIFSGPLESALAYGVAIAFLSAAVGGAIVAWRSSLPFAIAGPDSSISVVLAALVATLASYLLAHGATALLGPALIALSLTTAGTGAALWALGFARAGRAIRFVPYPVIGGFLGATGWMMVTGAIQVITNQKVTFDNLGAFASGPTAAKIVAGVAIAVVLHAATRYKQNTYILPVVLIAATVLTHLALLSVGASLAQAQATGWLFSPQPAGHLTLPWKLDELGHFPWAAVPSLAGDAIAVIFVTAITLLLNTTGIEIATRTEANIDRDLKALGFANIVTAALGGIVSCTSISRSVLVRLAGATTRICGLTVAAICAALLLIGPGILGGVPKYVLGGVLLFLGSGLLYQWLVRSSRQLPLPEYLSLLAIAFLIVYWGFIAGVLIGIVIGCATFALSVGRVNAIKFSFDGSEFRSSLDRGPDELAVLTAHGSEIQGMALQSYLFFGSANRLYQHVKELIKNFPECRFLIFDFRRVTGIDSSATHSFAQMKQAAAESGARIVLVNLAPELERAFRTARFIADDVIVASDLDRALESCEQQIINAHQAEGGDARSLSAWLAEALDSAELADSLTGYCRRLEVDAGEIIARQGDAAASMHFILEGRLGIIVELGDGRSVRVRSLGPHTTIGEMGLIARRPRSATIQAEVPSVLYELDAHAYETIKRERPALSQALLGYVIAVMTERLSFANRLIGVLQR
jgi:sulfate permease, SulP family